jgi:hypothetical protein
MLLPLTCLAFASPLPLTCLIANVQAEIPARRFLEPKNQVEKKILADNSP